MAKVTFLPENKTIEVEDGTTILEAARKIGIIIESPCNAVGTCGKCKVRLDYNSLKHVKQARNHHLSKDEELAGFCLSCETKILGDISVEVINKQKNKSLKILSHGKSFEVKVDSFVHKTFNSEKFKTEVFAGTELLGTEEGNTEALNYGVVVDIGTTTLVASLVDLNSGKELASSSVLNPQAVHAQDVLSRIKFASDENGLELMNSEFIKETNSLVDEIAKKAGISAENIYELIFSGNTCMLHLASKVNPYSLGKYPYDSEIKGDSHIKAIDHKLNVSPFGIVYLPPIISAYVGADITSGVLASELHQKKGVTLFVDIGTNGEMVIATDGRLSATSTAAGPAFEGMNIVNGMRAGNGAIELFDIEEDGSKRYRTIGDAKPIGICGSGLLDIVGELVAHKVINKNGKLVGNEDKSLLPLLRDSLVNVEGKWAFRISDEIFIYQKDIRQVQLAKGAVRAGIEFLLKSKELQAKDVDTVLIAGSFGYHLREKSLINIGLLPSEFEGKIEFVGNTSKSGGQAFLLNRGYRKLMKKIVKDIEVVELSNYKDFDKVFVQCLGF